jgi:hypothetical protein
MKDVTYIAAFPKSGITYLNYMLFHLLFDAAQDVERIDSDYIFDLHESLARVPPPGGTPRYVKIHFGFGPGLPLLGRASRAVYLVRDPIDVMMSVWDFKHLTGEEGLLRSSETERQAKFAAFRQRWLSTGGAEFAFAGSWVQNVRSWLEETSLPLLVVRYETLKNAPASQLERVLKFLGRPASAERIAKAVAAGSVENMRGQESREIANRKSGTFYRPFLAAGYAQGYRFVGKINQNSYDKVLSPAERGLADRIFAPVLARVRERSEA